MSESTMLRVEQPTVTYTSHFSACTYRPQCSQCFDNLRHDYSLDTSWECQPMSQHQHQSIALLYLQARCQNCCNPAHLVIQMPKVLGSHICSNIDTENIVFSHIQRYKCQKYCIPAYIAIQISKIQQSHTCSDMNAKSITFPHVQ